MRTSQDRTALYAMLVFAGFVVLWLLYTVIWFLQR